MTDFHRYKDLFAYKEILDYLDMRHKEQLAEGIVSPDERSSAYPF